MNEECNQISKRKKKPYLIKIKKNVIRDDKLTTYLMDMHPQKIYIHNDRVKICTMIYR
jgi:hypothetical protein